MGSFSGFQHWVVGFLFEREPELGHGRKVVLIRKLRPEWQCLKFNGIGGKIEDGERPEQAMRREFGEEAGLDIDNWEQCVTLRCPTGIVYFFRAFADNIHEVKSITDEEIVICWADILPALVIPNLRWLISLCLDKDVKFPVEVSEK